MAQVLSLAAERKARRQPDARNARIEYGLTILEAAKALDLSASAIEELERSDEPRFSLVEIRRKYELFLGTGGAGGKNLIFGHYPLRMAREVLGLSLEDMAGAFGYTANSWKRIEAHARPLQRETLERIERQVREKFSAICAATA